MGRNAASRFKGFDKQAVLRVLFGADPQTVLDALEDLDLQYKVEGAAQILTRAVGRITPALNTISTVATAGADIKLELEQHLAEYAAILARSTPGSPQRSVSLYNWGRSIRSRIKPMIDIIEERLINQNANTRRAVLALETDLQALAGLDPKGGGPERETTPTI